MSTEEKGRVAGKFGRLPTREDDRTLRFARYAGALPAPPASFDALQRVGANLKVPHPVGLFPMDGNDEWGCCTIAAAAHAETLWEGWCGKRRVPTRQAVVKNYLALSGGEDSGLVELDVLNSWRKTGITGEKILAYAAVDVSDTDRLKSAISIFGCVYIGFTVEQGAIRDFEAHRPWRAGPATNSGHAVVLTGYDANYLSLLTWGAVQRAEYGWLEMVGEAYAILPGEAVVKGFAPGFDLAALQSDLAAVTG